MEKNAEVPAYANTMVVTAEMALEKDESVTIL
jgi:hypothetical protein